MTTPEERRPPAARARAGMTVIDAAGEEIGTVTLVRLGDPEALTTQGQGEPEGPAAMLAALLGGQEPDVPPPFAQRLLRTGYLKIDCSGLFTADMYVSATDVAEVDDSTIRLAGTRRALIRET